MQKARALSVFLAVVLILLAVMPVGLAQDVAPAQPTIDENDIERILRRRIRQRCIRQRRILRRRDEGWETPKT